MSFVTINRDPSPRDLKIFAILQALFFAAIATIVHRRTGATVAPLAIVAVSLVMAIVGIVRPAGLRGVYVGWMLAVYPIGWVVSHLILAVVYFGIVTPTGWLLRCFGRAPLSRRFDPEARTYWTVRESEIPSDRYFRQY